jgi:general stress protein YciG
MNKAKYLIPLLFLLTNLFFSSCDNPKLKAPRPDSPSTEEKTGQKGEMIDREFARELAREFGKEFAIEFARQMKGAGTFSLSEINGSVEKNSSGGSSGILNDRGEAHPLLAGCSEDVLEFYQKHSDCFSIASTSDIPANLNWQEGAEEKEFSSPAAQKGGTWEVFMRDFPRTLRTIGP